MALVGINSALQALKLDEVLRGGCNNAFSGSGCCVLASVLTMVVLELEKAFGRIVMNWKECDRDAWIIVNPANGSVQLVLFQGKYQ